MLTHALAALGFSPVDSWVDASIDSPDGSSTWSATSASDRTLERTRSIARTAARSPRAAVGSLTLFVVLGCASPPAPAAIESSAGAEEPQSELLCEAHPEGSEGMWRALGDRVALCAQEHLREGVAIVGALTLDVITAPDGSVRSLNGSVSPPEREAAMLACLREGATALRLAPTEGCARASVEVALSSELETRELGRAARARLPDGTLRTVAHPRGEARFAVRTHGGLDELDARRRARVPLGGPLETCFARAIESTLRDRERFALDESLVLDVRWIGAIPPRVEVARAPSLTLAACASELVFEGAGPASGAFSARYVVEPRSFLHPDLVAGVEARESR